MLRGGRLMNVPGAGMDPGGGGGVMVAHRAEGQHTFAAGDRIGLLLDFGKRRVTVPRQLLA
jgi:hypothetical protein